MSIESSGGPGILNIGFQNPVYKFDSSTFYNYEQDNLPITDLEDRVDYLHQIMGYPGSSVPGVTMTLSSTANNEEGVYDDIDDIIARIPKRLTFPILIELCSYGDIGDLILTDINCEKGGSIEVVNRNFGVDPNIVFSAVETGLSGSQVGTQTTWSKTSTAAGKGSKLDYEGGSINDASSSRTTANCFDQTQWGENVRAFASHYSVVPHSTTLYGYPVRMDMTIGKSGYTFIEQINAARDLYALSAYNALNDDTIRTGDVYPRTKNGDGTSLEDVLNFKEDDTNYPSFLTAYGNYFSKVVVRNCHGDTVKLTNICIDSASGDDHSGSFVEHLENYGLLIDNSEVKLENVAAIRCSKAGMRVKNSEVSSTGFLISERNYELANQTRGNEGVGLLVENSVFEFDASTTNKATQNRVDLTKNGVGLKAVNSTIKGGVVTTDTSSAGTSSDSHTTKLQTYLNDSGIQLINSEFEWNGRVVSYNNLIGLQANNSIVTLGQASIILNQNEGILLDQSKLTYGNKCNELANPPGVDGFLCQTHISQNGQNLVATNQSSVKPFRFNNMPSKYHTWGGSGTDLASTHHGTIARFTNAVPSIYIGKGSEAELVSFAHKTTLADIVAKGVAAVVEDNSKLIFKGTGKYNTQIYSTNVGNDFDNLLPTWMAAGVYSNNNSTVEFNGPTVIARYGVDVLAENKSTVLFKPPTYPNCNGFYLDEDAWDLSSTVANHTKVDLHSTRACVVANRNSGVIMYQLGGSANEPTQTVDAVGGDSSGLHDEYWQSTSAGYMQFYPNPFSFITTGTAAVSAEGSNIGVRTTPLYTQADQISGTKGGMCLRAVNNSFVDVNFVNFPMGVEGSTLLGSFYSFDGSGGEELGGWQGQGGGNAGEPPVIGGGGAGPGGGYGNHGGVGSAPGTIGAGSQIHIWNIADTSRIHAANLLVSGVEPSSLASTYHGPVGHWWNGVALDYYGISGYAAANAGFTGGNTWRNPGPFRLMFSHRGDVKAYYELSGGQADIGIASSNGGSPLDQILSQGYLAPQPTVSSLPGADQRLIIGLEKGDTGSYEGEDHWGLGASATDPNVAKLPHIQTYTYSGAAVVSPLNPNIHLPVLHGDWQGYIRNWLDETAAATFANASHAANKKIGLLSVYRSSTEVKVGGEGRDGPGTYGVGVRSLNLFDLERLV